MKTFVDERASPRIEKDVTIFIEMQSASTEDQSDIVICKSLDLSSHGLQVALDRSIPADWQQAISEISSE